MADALTEEGTTLVVPQTAENRAGLQPRRPPRSKKPGFDGFLGDAATGLRFQFRSRSGRGNCCVYISPSGQLPIRQLNLVDNFGPQIALQDPRWRIKPRGLPNLRIRNEQPQHALQVMYIPPAEGEARAFNHFTIFGNVAGQHANARS